MIFADLQNGIKDYLVDDAYFSASPGVAVYCEDADKPEEFLDNIHGKFTSVGIVAGIGVPDVEISSSDVGNIILPIVVWENPQLNRKPSTGTQKKCASVAFKIAAMLMNHQLEGDLEYWHRIKVTGVRRLGAEDGLLMWQVMVKTGTILDTILTYLESSSGSVLMSDSGSSFFVTPTEP